uniref:CHC2 zinc finger domain-containing protein n=1 Tax=Pedobacter sp. TaxID=1411316 RepID=UPI001597F1F6|nr:CHC2 zinc finger domain-containing protein [Pedobacter sp.]QJS06225.1 DNA primase, catalytic core [Pedobacter sp.]
MKINYEQLTAQAAKIKSEISVLDYFFKLESLGTLRYDGKKGKEYFFGFEHQKTGSISIKDKENLWYDHAKGEGGDIIKAVQEFENKSFVEAVNRLSNNSDIVPDAYQAFFKKNGETEYNIKIEKVLDRIQHPALISYLNGRGLDLKDVDVAKEVHWTNGTDHFFGIGFENSNGGYAVRSKVYKGNINGGGISTFTIGNNPSSIKMFEGSMDFSSYRHVNPLDSFHAIILNGTGNLTEKLCVSVKSKSSERDIPVHLYFDNGEGGHKATIKAQKFIPSSQDKSLFYSERGLNDLNDFLVDSLNTEYRLKR